MADHPIAVILIALSAFTLLNAGGILAAVARIVEVSKKVDAVHEKLDGGGPKKTIVPTPHGLPPQGPGGSR